MFEFTTKLPEAAFKVAGRLNERGTFNVWALAELLTTSPATVSVLLLAVPRVKLLALLLNVSPVTL